MTIAAQWAAARKERDCAGQGPPRPQDAPYAMGQIQTPAVSEIQHYQQQAAEQRLQAREARRRDALPYCELEELTLP